jgi:lysophospholipase L1-like esterase
MASEYTTNFNLDLYTDTDKPNLRDQYNGAMHKIDSQLNTLSNNFVVVTEAANQAKEKADAASDAVTKETARAEAAEKANADAISAETDRAKAAEKVNADSIAAETVRAKAAEKTNADAIARVKTAAYLDTTSTVVDDDTLIPTSKAVYNFTSKEKKTILCFGDSYAEAEVAANTWPYQLGLASGCTIKNYAISGAGFDVGGNLFSTQLNTAVSDASIDKSKVKALVLAGGRNDIMSYSTADTLAYSWARTALSAFPDAKVYVVPMLYDSTSCGDTGRIKAAGIADGAMRAGAIVVNYAWTWLRGLPNQIQSDKVHPNATGARTIANYIWSAIQGNYNPRHMAYTADWCGATVYIEACAGLVNIQVQGSMTEDIKTFDIPSFAAPYMTASTIMYTNSGSANHILMCDPTSMYIYGASGILDGVGGTLTFPW